MKCHPHAAFVLDGNGVELGGVMFSSRKRDRKKIVAWTAGTGRVASRRVGGRNRHSSIYMAELVSWRLVSGRPLRDSSQFGRPLSAACPPPGGPTDTRGRRRQSDESKDQLPRAAAVAVPLGIYILDFSDTDEYRLDRLAGQPQQSTNAFVVVVDASQLAPIVFDATPNRDAESRVSAEQTPRY